MCAVDRRREAQDSQAPEGQMSDTLFASVEGAGKELARAPSTMDIIAQGDKWS
jgi:hypothetical protein